MRRTTRIPTTRTMPYQHMGSRNKGNTTKDPSHVPAPATLHTQRAVVLQDTQHTHNATGSSNSTTKEQQYSTPRFERQSAVPPNAPRIRTLLPSVWRHCFEGRDTAPGKDPLLHKRATAYMASKTVPAHRCEADEWEQPHDQRETNARGVHLHQLCSF